uniref:Replication factor C C-terminal domain-containing protein n=1 Tax=Oryza glaberrima TaxID=4538 RepID=I1QW74_ORYGL
MAASEAPQGEVGHQAGTGWDTAIAIGKRKRVIELPDRMAFVVTGGGGRGSRRSERLEVTAKEGRPKSSLNMQPEAAQITKWANRMEMEILGRDQMAMSHAAATATTLRAAHMAPPATTLSDALDHDRRRDARRYRTFLPPSQLVLGLHRLGFACIPRSGAPLTRPRTAPSSVPHQPPPRREAPQPQVANAAVAERRPLREREEAAAAAAAKRIHDHHTPAESKAEAASEPQVSAGDHSTQSSDHSASAVAVGRGGSIWVRVLPKSVAMVDSPQTSEESTPTAEDKYIWADKYRPNFLNDFICNKDAALELYNQGFTPQVTAQECNHIIFEGPTSVGKRSMVSALIRDAFATDNLKIEEQTKRFELKGEIAKHIDIRVKISSHHVEAVRHLCKVVTLKPPSSDEIIKVLEYIAVQESIDLPRDIARRITMSSGNNLRQAIRSFEATWKANYAFLEGHAILTGWEEEISNVAKKILEEPSPKQLYVIRGKIRKLIEHNVSPYFIFSNLVAELKRDRDEEFQNSIDQLASELNHIKDCARQKEQCESGDTGLEIRNINIEGFAKEGHDQRETIQCFIKIEEFTVRFMGFYRSLKAKNMNRGGVL